MTRWCTDPRQMSLHFDDWPKPDQTLWQASTEPGTHSFKGRTYAQGLKTPSLHKLKEGYGRFLGAVSWLEPSLLDLPPGDRVSRALCDRFLDLMKEMGNRDHTILGRFAELQGAMRILLPAGEWGWLTKPDSWSLRSSFLMRCKSKRLHDPKDLADWAVDLIATARTINSPLKAAAQVRDGVIIHLLAHRAPRLRSLTLMQIGQHLQVSTAGYRAVFEAGDMKNKRRLEYNLPESLTPLMQRYLSYERKVLLGDQKHDHLWVDRRGGPLSDIQIRSMIQGRSRIRFGHAFGPHVFRHCLNTGSSLIDPDNPGIGSALLGITQTIADKHYNLAANISAANHYHQALAAARLTSNSEITPK